MKLLQVTPDVLERVWPVAAPFLDKAASHSHGMASSESTKPRIAGGVAQLWLIVEDEKPHRVVAAGTTSITEYPTGRRALLIELLGGNDMRNWFDAKDDLERWAKANGCGTVFCWARKGWAKRMQDYQLSHYVLAKELQ